MSVHSTISSGSPWYALFSRGARDWLRHNEKIRESVQQKLPDLVAGGDLITGPQERTVHVPVKVLEHARFRLSDNAIDSERHAGQGQGQPGDVLRPAQPRRRRLLPHRLDQLRDVGRLAQILVRARHHRLLRRQQRAVAGQHDHGDMRVDFAQLLQGPDSVHFRHPDVEHHGGERARVELGERLLGPFRGVHLEFPRQAERDRFARAVFVVHHEHGRFFLHGVGRGGRRFLDQHAKKVMRVGSAGGRGWTRPGGRVSAIRIFACQGVHPGLIRRGPLPTVAP